MMKQDQTKSLYSLRKLPVQQRSKATVEAVLEAGARLLLSVGYDKASTNKIADLAGVSVGSLYEYFPGKEAIFAEMRRREDMRLYRLLMAGPLPRNLSEMARLHVTAYTELIRTNLKLHTALIREVPQFAVVEAESRLYSEHFPRTDEFLRSNIRDLRPQCDIPIISELLNRVVRATINDYALHAPERLEDKVLARELQDMLERYLLY